MSICTDHVENAISAAVTNAVQRLDTELVHELLDILEVAIPTREQQLVLFFVCRARERHGGKSEILFRQFP